MTKELFVSSTPHETKVGLVEDDQLAEIYLERENEYTLAGSIYKGRVTRVLPGMQSAFVDIGLERDAFLYVSDFLDLEDHDEDLTDAVPTNRPPASEPRAQAPRIESAPAPVASSSEGGAYVIESEPFEDEPQPSRSAPAQASADSDAEESGSSDRGFRGRRRRGRGRGRDRFDRNERSDRGDRGDRSDRSERTSTESRSPRSESHVVRRDDEYGPPPGYQPILLPGESISKYQRRGPAAVAPKAEPVASAPVETPVELAKTFPEDEPLFAAAMTEQAHVAPGEEVARQQWEHEHAIQERMQLSALFRKPEDDEEETEAPAVAEAVGDIESVEKTVSDEETPRAFAETRGPEPSAFFERHEAAGAAAGTMEEEEIDEEEADLASYVEELEEDATFEELEEETRAAEEHREQQIGSALLPVVAASEDTAGEHHEAAHDEHTESAAEAGLEASQHEGSREEGSHEEEGEDDSEELEIEDAQAEAEALLEAEARGNGTVDARAEMRGPSNAGYTQRTQRQGFDRRRGRRGGRRFRSGPRRENTNVPLISDLLKEGQEVLIQIAKEPIGKKGARITSHIALPGRFLVYMPTVNHTGVSRKISSEEERQRLKRIIISERENGTGGFIVRTAASGASEDELRADIRFLKNLWTEIKTRAENSKAPALIYHDLNVVERVLRDQVTSDFSAIWVDTEQEYERILRFANRFQPALVRRVKLYTKETPLFEQFGLREEVDKALKSKVWLKSGGYIVINQTEALVAIDVNTGKYVGKTARLEDTIVKTNVDAIKEIVRQIRLRDLGGIIVIDFIDMDERRNRQKVMQALEEELHNDRAPSKVLQFNDFGLVAITRKRVKQSLERTIGAPCPYCQSTGYVKSITTVCNEIYVEMRKIAKHLERSDVMLRVNPEVAKALKAQNGRWLNEMEELTKRTIIVKSDGTLHTEQFDIN
jgi:ribonuclease G